jgi:subtilisin family serine protease
MAAPHVAGVVALYLEKHPAATPAEVHDAIVGGASTDLLATLLMRPGTPNRLLFSRFMDEGDDAEGAQRGGGEGGAGAGGAAPVVAASGGSRPSDG